MIYAQFIESKAKREVATGHQPGKMPCAMFDFQSVISQWAIRRGRAAIFADTGLGKTLMQLAWAQDVARHTDGIVLILAPLAVSEQTIEQGQTFGVAVKRVPHGQTPDEPGIWITNYERMDVIDFESLHGLVLDESSILKSHDGKTRTKIIDAAQGIPYRLSCTATPSPNDFDELGNQCEFLGVMSRTEMLATYFVNDTGDTGTWRLKKYGRVKFWEWMGTWAVVLRNPSDIGFNGDQYILPPLEYFEHVVESRTLGDLFAKQAGTLQERRQVQRESIEDRCKKVAEIVAREPDEPWLIWCHLNDEAELLASLIPGAVNVQGSDSPEFKVAAAQWYVGNCSCDVKVFRDKLAEFHEDKTCQNSHTSSSTTEKTKQGASPNRRPISNRTKSTEKNICANTLAQTEKNSEGIQNSNRNITTEEGSNTPKIQHCVNDTENKQESGQETILKNEKNSGLENTASPQTSTKQSTSHKKGNAPFVDVNSQTENLSTSTIATNLESLEDCYVVNATSGSESFQMIQKNSQGQPCICGSPKTRKLISKAKIFGYGLNFQHCARMAFVGLDDSFEKFYQAVRRCYRFGQKRSVQVHVVIAESEGMILRNLKRKETQHHEMSASMIEHMRGIMDKELKGTVIVTNQYEEDIHESKDFTVYLGDCVKQSRHIADESIDYSVFSPPFADLFVYSNSDYDMGNCADDQEFAAQMRFLIAELFRVMKPGRNVSFHCMNLPTTKMRQGFIGLRDFRGDLIRAFQDAGFIYHSEVCIWKDPVTAMQRTKALGLLHKTIRENSTMTRMGLPDYVVTMRKPGEVQERVKHGEDLPVALWQQYASPVWMDINQSRTLNKLPARSENDEKHMCPLQLDVIERCIHLWTSPNDLIFSPFTGIGSEGYCAVKMGRRFVGIELKRQYYELAIENINDALNTEQFGLFAS